MKKLKKARKQKKRDLTAPSKPTEHLEMQIVNPRAGAVDIGSREHYVCLGLNRVKDVRIFGNTTAELNALCDWLEMRGVEQFAMESTGHYWYALHDLIKQRGKIEVILVNGRFSKNISGRKSDLLDCEWLYKLHSFGLLRGSFLTDAITDDLKRLTRHRQNLVRESVRYMARVGKCLRRMNIVLDSVLSTLQSVSGHKMIEAMIRGERNAEVLADMADRHVKSSREKRIAALTGNWHESSLFEIKQCYDSYVLSNRQIDELDLQINRILAKTVSNTEGVYQPFAKVEKPQEAQEAQEVQQVQQVQQLEQEEPLRYIKSAVFNQKKSGQPKAERLPIQRVKRYHHPHEIPFDIQGYGYKLWGTDLFEIPGIGRESVLMLMSEIGGLQNWQRFPTAGHFSAWLGLLPNNRISGGKVLSSHRIRKDNRVSNTLRNAAATLIKEGVKKTSALHRFGQRIMHKKGKTAAVVALASKMAKIIWHCITKQESFKQPSLAEYEQTTRQQTLRTMQKKIVHFNITAEELSIIV